MALPSAFHDPALGFIATVLVSTDFDADTAGGPARRAFDDYAGTLTWLEDDLAGNRTSGADPGRTR